MNRLYWNTRWETLASVIMGALMIALIVGSMARIISMHYAAQDTYERKEALFFLQNNASNIIRKLNTSSIPEKDIFAVYKDNTSRQFLVKTGALAQTYKYVDQRGDWVSNTGSFGGTIYTQLFFVDRTDASLVSKQIIKGEVRELIRAQ